MRAIVPSAGVYNCGEGRSGTVLLRLDGLIHRHARYRATAPAVTFEDTTLDWRAFQARASRVAHMLAGLGVAKGDKVATVAGNSLELLETYWAVPMLGAVLVPLSPLLLGAGLAGLLRDSDAKCLVTQRAMLPALREIEGELGPELRRRVLVTDGPEAGCLDYQALSAQASAAPPPDPGVAEDDLYNIMYTSGTTGLPKGIMHSHFTRSMYCLILGSAFRFTPESVALHTGALIFNGAFVTMMPTFYQGAHFVVLRQFDAAAALEAIARHRVTHMMVVPTQIVAMLGSPAFAAEKLASLQMILSLGAPLLQEHKDRLNALLPGRFHELYGLTEGFITILDKTDAVRKSGSVGIPAPYNEMRIVREDGSEAAAGEVGEIAGRGPLLMQGYYQRPDLTAQALRAGWLYTGDLGYADEEGYLHLVDRKKDMIDSGGVKVYPRDIEEIAARHPAIRDVAVFGVPDDKWGETPVAAVVLAAPGAASAEDLRRWINERVAAKYQRVSRVVLHEDFPRSAAGKTLKRELRQPYWEGRERKI
jgi:acyl-CoA synthetase (AMP-forming)/AMP-acid ligase II